MLKAGIVGLPNVGKSTLFNALTRSRKAEAANYPFCTIDPNVGMVVVPDERAYVRKAIAKTNVVVPAAIEFVDIAGMSPSQAKARASAISSSPTSAKPMPSCTSFAASRMMTFVMPRVRSTRCATSR